MVAAGSYSCQVRILGNFLAILFIPTQNQNKARANSPKTECTECLQPKKRKKATVVRIILVVVELRPFKSRRTNTLKSRA